jgi:hypothetical protein
MEGISQSVFMSYILWELPTLSQALANLKVADGIC